MSEKSTGMVVARARAEFGGARNRCVVGLRACFWIFGLAKEAPTSTMPLIKSSKRRSV